MNLREHVVAETWVLQDCRLSGITLRCLDSCLGKSQSVDLKVTDNCLPHFFIELETYKYTITSNILLINWHIITGYLATALEGDYKNRVGPYPESRLMMHWETG